MKLYRATTTTFKWNEYYENSHNDTTVFEGQLFLCEDWQLPLPDLSYGRVAKVEDYYEEIDLKILQGNS